MKSNTICSVVGVRDVVRQPNMPFFAVSMPLLKLCTKFNIVQNLVVHLYP